jgi:hypothetical protein
MAHINTIEEIGLTHVQSPSQNLIHMEWALIHLCST